MTHPLTPRTGRSRGRLAPWVYKRNGLYYNVFAAGCCSEFIGYSTAPGPTGPWTYRGTVMPRQGSSFTNHPGVIDFAGTLSAASLNVETVAGTDGYYLDDASFQ